MKRILWTLAALASLWATGAGAQPVGTDGNAGRTTAPNFVPVGGWVVADSSDKKARLTSTGAFNTNDEDRDRNYVRTWQSSEVISNSSIAAAAGDSSGVIDVSPYRYLKLLIKATPIGAAANTTVRLAFQFRECLNGNVDSTSSFPEYQYGVFPVGSITASTRADTTIAGHLVTPSVPATEAWSGEYVVTFNMNRSAPASGAAANVWSYPNGVGLPLESLFGRPARFNNLQIRVRNINLTGPAVKLDVAMIGFAQ